MTEVVSFPALGLSFTLKRVAFQAGPFTVYWYGILIAIGVALALAYALTRARKSGVHPDRFIDVIMGGFVGGIVGARLYYVVFEWDYFKDHLSDIYKTWTGGLGIYGGIIGALLVAWLVCRWRKVKVLPVFDLAAMGFLIGQSIGRWGNFMNVEAFGSNTAMPWGMTSDKIMYYLAANAEKLQAQGMNVVINDPVHPTFLYESLWCLLGFIVLNFYFKRRRFDGEIFLLYTAWYGFGRFFIEGLRTDSLVIGAVRVSQVLAAVLMFAAIIIEIAVRYRIATEHDPEYLKPYGQTEESARMLAELDEQLKSKSKKSKKAEEAAGDEAQPLTGEDEPAQPDGDAEQPMEEADLPQTDEPDAEAGEPQAETAEQDKPAE